MSDEGGLAGVEFDDLLREVLARVRGVLDEQVRLRLLLDAVVRIELLTADAASARGARLSRGSASPPVAGALRVLLGARREGRAKRGGDASDA